ncbi:MAG TPA: methionine--tRNA ligase, partial [Candidatus Wildermuthbacteria bacterium]|nr:methionine--tRNA ligase [Candidatus Wildermuthbacteria bacterium]
MNKFYLTTTIPYVNAAPHIGHALEFVQADVIARYKRSRGDEVYFLSGSDDNAIKNVQAAEEAGIDVKKFVEQNSKIFEDLLSKLNVSIDQFIRTTEDRHKKGAQALWEATDEKYIYKKTYKGLYCVGCELFYKQDELNEKGECNDCLLYTS